MRSENKKQRTLHCILDRLYRPNKLDIKK